MKIEEIKGYLGTGVKVINRVNKVVELRIEEYEHHEKSGSKPLLRPLSDLTKEITVDSETFVPINKLFELEYAGTAHTEGNIKMYTNRVGRFIQSSHFSTAMNTTVNVVNVDRNNHWKIVQLYKWHFDLNDLITKGQAIDLNTIEG